MGILSSSAPEGRVPRHAPSGLYASLWGLSLHVRTSIFQMKRVYVCVFFPWNVKTCEQYIYIFFTGVLFFCWPLG